MCILSLISVQSFNLIQGFEVCENVFQRFHYIHTYVRVKVIKVITRYIVLCNQVTASPAAVTLIGRTDSPETLNADSDRGLYHHIALHTPRSFKASESLNTVPSYSVCYTYNCKL